MAEPLEDEHDGDPWAEGPVSTSPWCDTCEGAHDDHAAWLAGKAAAVAGWSESAKALEEALDRSRSLLARMRAARHGPGEPADEQAMERYREIARQVAGLRQVADAAAWRAWREAEAASASQWCGHCGARITLLGGQWADGDGTIACTDTSAAFVPHKPEARADGGRDAGLQDEIAAAASAVQAARDAREAWNDPD